MAGKNLQQNGTRSLNQWQGGEGFKGKQAGVSYRGGTHTGLRGTGGIRGKVLGCTVGQTSQAKKEKGNKGRVRQAKKQSKKSLGEELEEGWEPVTAVAGSGREKGIQEGVVHTHVAHGIHTHMQAYV